MGVDSPGLGSGSGADYRCRWVRHRLPLLAGGELTGSDRRKVERHLIGCPGCRRHERSVAGALGVLQAAASRPPAGAGAGPEAPSLWPALARQIRESRHEPRSWRDDLARLFRPSSRLRPALVLAGSLAFAALTAAGVETWVRWRVTEATARIADATLPVEYDDDFGPDLAPAPVAPLLAAVEPPPSGPVAVPQQKDRDAPATVVAERTAARFDYDLDHGTPMGPDTLDVKASY